MSSSLALSLSLSLACSLLFDPDLTLTLVIVSFVCARARNLRVSLYAFVRSLRAVAVDAGIAGGEFNRFAIRTAGRLWQLEATSSEERLRW